MRLCEAEFFCLVIIVGISWVIINFVFGRDIAIGGDGVTRDGFYGEIILGGIGSGNGAAVDGFVGVIYVGR